MNQRIVIITGMHRSGTSLGASILQKAGVNIGDNVIGPNESNPRGHFEDVDFFQFQENILNRLGQTIIVQQALDLNEITLAETDLAKRLIETHHDKQIWGWKDPRTCLFLDFWHTLLPQANYIFIYRHPLEVLLSLLRRGTDLEVLVDPLMGVRAWQVYNQAILSFYQQHPGNCFLANVSGIVEDIAGFVGMVTKKLNLTLQEKDGSVLYQAAELRKIDLLSESMSLLKQIMPESLALYEQLEKQADLSGSESANGRGCEDANGRGCEDANPFACSPIRLFAISSIRPFAISSIRKLLVEQRQKDNWLEQQHAEHLAWIAELEQGKKWLEQQHAEHLAWIAELEQGKKWLEQQHAEHLAWIAELEQGKNWLEEQWQHWQAVATNQQTTMTKVKQHPLIRLMTRLRWVDWEDNHD